MFTPPSDRKLRGLALLLAAHVDDLQMLAASLARRMHDAYSGDSRELRGILTDVYASLSDDMKPNTYAYASSVKRMRQAILDFRKPRYERMMAILEEELEELERNEEQFTLAWIAAVHEAFGLDAPKTSGLSKRTADEIRKYGVYNGETVKTIFGKVMTADIDRLSSAVASVAGERNAAGIANLRDDIDRAINTSMRQIAVNVSMVVNGVSNDTSREIAKKNAKYADKVMWVTELDERVCEDCADLEGQVFDADEVPECPAHPNCRCRVIPVMEEMAPYLLEVHEE